MSLLSDHDVQRAMHREGLGIEPFDVRHLGPASYDVTLDPIIRRPTPGVDAIDVASVPKGHTTLEQPGPIVLEPGDFILATTVESIQLPKHLAARVEGRSSLGRLGLLVHITAGFIDPGFQGQVTLEIVNLAPWSTTLQPGMRVAQLAFFNLTRATRNPYGERGHYQGQEGPTESRFRL